MGEVIVMRCPMCDKTHQMTLSDAQSNRLWEWEQGFGAIQELLPDLNPVEREFLKSGYCPDCQEELFGNGETFKISRYNKEI